MQEHPLTNKGTELPAEFSKIKLEFFFFLTRALYHCNKWLRQPGNPDLDEDEVNAVLYSQSCSGSGLGSADCGTWNPRVVWVGRDPKNPPWASTVPGCPLERWDLNPESRLALRSCWEVWCVSHRTWIILSQRWHSPALSVQGLPWPETWTARKLKRNCKALSAKVWNPHQIPILSCKNRRFLFWAVQTPGSHKSPRRELIPP